MKLLDKLIPDMTISSMLKIVGGVLTVLLILVVTSVLVLFNFFDQEREAVNSEVAYKELGYELLETHDYITEQVRRFTQSAEMEYYENYQEVVNEEQRRERIIEDFKELGLPDEELELIESSVQRGVVAGITEREAINLVMDGFEEDPRFQRQNLERARNLVYGGYYDARREEAMDYVDEFIETMETRIAGETEAARDMADLFLMITFGLVVLVLVTIILSFLVLYRKITIPLRAAVDFVDKIADGDLNVAKLKIRGKDELAQLSKGLNQMRQDLKSTITKIMDLIKNLSSYNQEIATTNKKINDVFELIKGVKQRNKETSSSVDEISNSIREIAKGTESLAIKAEKISNIGDESFNLVKKTDKKIDHGNELVENAVNTMKDLDNSVAKVEKVSDKIMDIADQTNLLSLMGAVESANTDGLDEGFGEVADEIKDLADESMQAAETVKDIVSEVKEVTNQAIDIMVPRENSDDNIADVFSEIQNLSKQVKDSMEDTTEATADQGAATEEISAAVEEISAASDEVSDQTDELYIDTKELEEIMQKVAEFNEELCEEFEKQVKESELQLELVNVDM